MTAASEIQKLVMVGDDDCGKTSLLQLFGRMLSPENVASASTPTCGQTGNVEVDGRSVRLNVWDTLAGEDFDRLRYKVVRDN